MISQKTILETQNFQLRIFNKGDIDFIFSATRFAGFNDGIGWEAPSHKEELLPSLENNTKVWAEGLGYGFIIVGKGESPQQFGRVSIRKTEEPNQWDVGFWVHPEQQGKGVMTEALSAILTFGFTTLQAGKIRAQYATWNKASEKVMFKHGFQFVKHIEQGLLKNKEWIPENEFCLTKENWENKNSEIKRSCHFCEILKNSENIIFENEELIVLFDMDPISLGHVLICPKKHYTDFHNLPDGLIQEMMLIAKKYIKLMQRLFPNKGYSMMLNAGEFNDLKHCHLHVFPRNSKEEFEWTYSEEYLSKDATKFEVLKKMVEGYF